MRSPEHEMERDSLAKLCSQYIRASALTLMGPAGSMVWEAKGYLASLRI